MKKTGWKILFTIACLALAGGLMIGSRNAEASENDVSASEPETGEEATTDEKTDSDGPLIEWKMEEVNVYDGISYYREDNCGISITISDADAEPVLAEAKVGDAGFSLDDFEMTGEGSYVLALTADDLSDLIREDGEVTAYVYVQDADDHVNEDALTFVLDRVSPEFTLSLEEPSGDETVDGETAYYGSSHDQLRAVYTITEENFDPLLIGAERVREDITDRELSMNAVPGQITGGAGFSNGQTYLVETDIGTEGIYRFGISGTDRAGNPLVMSDGEMRKQGYQKCIQSESGGYWTEPKVLDLTKPSLSFAVSGPDQKIFYEGMAAGDAVTVSEYEPFQQSEWAKVMIRTEDETPCLLDYQIMSSSEQTISAEKKEQFLENPVASESISGQQKFWIGQIEVKDRAGNTTIIGRSNALFLDLEGPTAEIRAPKPIALATDKITHRCADGQGLYNDDVTLQVTVKDAEGSEAGSGIGNISCKVFVNGKETDSGNAYADRLSECLDDAPDFTMPERVSYGDDSVLSACMTEYTGTITIPKGDVFETNNIEVRVYAGDNAGNRTEGDEIGRMKLGIDSVGPDVTAGYDNNDVQNDMYFKAPRTALIRISDRNIDEDLIRIDTQGTVAAGLSYEDGRDDSGNGDCYQKEIRFNKDGSYTLKISGTDALGNAFAGEVSMAGASPDRFVIDQTAPEISIEDLEEGNAYNGEVAPRIRFLDENYAKDSATLSLSGAREGDRTDLIPSILTDQAGGSCQMQNIPAVKENDDIYTMAAKVKDLAGNEMEKTIEFSVNRFGSTYDYNNDRPTQDLMDAYYVGREKNLYLREININRLTDQKVTLYHDGSNRVLQRGTDYRLKQEAYGDSMQYVYEFFGRNFKKEGIYEVVVQSQDAAGNINSNRSMHKDSGVEPVSIRFAIDKTAPQILLNGADATKAPAFPEGEAIQILPEDNMRLDGLQIATESAQKETVLESYTGQALSQKLAKTEGALTFIFDADHKDQTLVIRAVDAAGNESIGTASVLTQQEMKRSGIFLPGTTNGKNENADSGGDVTQRPYGIILTAAALLLLFFSVRKKSGGQ